MADGPIICHPPTTVTLSALHPRAITQRTATERRECDVCHRNINIGESTWQDLPFDACLYCVRNTMSGAPQRPSIVQNPKYHIMLGTTDISFGVLPDVPWNAMPERCGESFWVQGLRTLTPPLNSDYPLLASEIRAIRALMEETSLADRMREQKEARDRSERRVLRAAETKKVLEGLSVIAGQNMGGIGERAIWPMAIGSIPMTVTLQQRGLDGTWSRKVGLDTTQYDCAVCSRAIDKDEPKWENVGDVMCKFCLRQLMLTPRLTPRIRARTATGFRDLVLQDADTDAYVHIMLHAPLLNRELPWDPPNRQGEPFWTSGLRTPFPPINWKYPLTEEEVTVLRALQLFK